MKPPLPEVFNNTVIARSPDIDRDDVAISSMVLSNRMRLLRLPTSSGWLAMTISR